LALRLPWRNAIPAGTAFSRFRLHSDPIGSIFEYGRIDDLVITGAPEDPNAFPPPTISLLSPFPYAVIGTNEALQFEVSSMLPITRTNLSVILNGQDVSSSLVVSGTNGQLSVTCNLLAVNQRYTAEISATNNVGNSTE